MGGGGSGGGKDAAANKAIQREARETYKYLRKNRRTLNKTGKDLLAKLRARFNPRVH